MTKLEKCVVGMGAGISTLIVSAFGILALHSPSSSISPNTAVQTATGSNPPQYKAQGFGQSDAVQSALKSPAAQSVVEVVNPLPANATFVPDGNLQQLSMMVDLAGARDQQPDKKQWTQAVAVAQKLIMGPCDCAQRVWLRNFIEMGNYALSDSDAKYHESARLMAAQGRNNSQSMALSRRTE